MPIHPTYCYWQKISIPHTICQAIQLLGKGTNAIERADVAAQIISAASSPPYVNIPEIIIYPLSSGIVKRDNLS